MVQYNLFAGVLGAGKVFDDETRVIVSIYEIAYGALNLKNSLLVVWLA